MFVLCSDPPSSPTQHPAGFVSLCLSCPSPQGLFQSFPLALTKAYRVYCSSHLFQPKPPGFTPVVPSCFKAHRFYSVVPSCFKAHKVYSVVPSYFKAHRVYSRCLLLLQSPQGLLQLFPLASKPTGFISWSHSFQIQQGLFQLFPLASLISNHTVYSTCSHLLPLSMPIRFIPVVSTCFPYQQPQGLFRLSPYQCP